jgi:hypothetical protein
MKYLMLSFTFLFYLHGLYCQTWKDSFVKGSDGMEIYYNADDIRILDIGDHKHVIKAWFKEKFSSHKSAGITYKNCYSLTMYAFDYKEKLWSINEIIYYDSSNKVIQEYPFGLEWRETPLSTQIAFLEYTICSKYADK